MESDIRIKKKYKKTIWTLDNIPKFIIVEFYTKKLSTVYKLTISWNRNVKGIENNIITIQVSYSNIFHEDKKVSIDRFKMEPLELVKDVYNNLNKIILLQGLMIESFDNKVSRRVHNYNNIVLKYINKKINKIKLKDIKKLNNFIN